MYSVILMAAMATSTAEAPAFGHKGCGGCQGGLYLHNACYGCCGGGYGCYGACYGCYGCSGCWGSCTGCYGSCYGYSSCCGCHGHYSACYGCMGCYGVYDGGWSGYGAAVYDGGMIPAGNPMQAPVTTPATTPPATPPAGAKPGTSAKLIIEKPADAKIFVDERLVKSEGTRQTFATPVLDPAQAYFYTVRIESVRDGKPTSETRRVIVRAGETIQEAFNDAGIATASAAK